MIHLRTTSTCIAACLALCAAGRFSFVRQPLTPHSQESHAGSGPCYLSVPDDTALAEWVLFCGDIERIITEVEGLCAPFGVKPNGQRRDRVLASAALLRNEGSRRLAECQRIVRTACAPYKAPAIQWIGFALDQRFEEAVTLLSPLVEDLAVASGLTDDPVMVGRVEALAALLGSVPAWIEVTLDEGRPAMVQAAQRILAR